MLGFENFCFLLGVELRLTVLLLVQDAPRTTE